MLLRFLRLKHQYFFVGAQDNIIGIMHTLSISLVVSIQSPRVCRGKSLNCTSISSHLIPSVFSFGALDGRPFQTKVPYAYISRCRAIAKNHHSRTLFGVHDRVAYSS